MNNILNVLLRLPIPLFLLIFFPLRIRGKFKKAGKKGAFKHNLRIIISFALILLTAAALRFIPPENRALTMVLNLLVTAFLVLYIVFIVKGMKAGNAAIRGTSPAVSPGGAGAVVPSGDGAALPGIKCPHCGSPEFQPLGAEGFMGRTVAALFLGWLLARVFEGQIGNRVVYKCGRCQKKWTASPAPADGAQALNQPCVIEVTRPGGFVGAIVPQFVYLNGEKIARLANGKTVTFSTSYSHNILFVTDQTGAAFKEFRRFEAEPGGRVAFNFNRKFL